MSDWISVKDRLPNDNERVLVHVVGKPFNIDADRFFNSRWVRWNGVVTHWMPLPEPPEAL